MSRVYQNFFTKLSISLPDIASQNMYNGHRRYSIAYGNSCADLIYGNVNNNANFCFKRTSSEAYPVYKGWFAPYINLEEMKDSKKYKVGRVRIYNDNGVITRQIIGKNMVVDVHSTFDLNRSYNDDIVVFEVYENEERERNLNFAGRVVRILNREPIPEFYGRIRATLGDFYMLKSGSHIWNKGWVSKKDRVFSQSDDINTSYIGKFTNWPEDSKFPILKLLSKFSHNEKTSKRITNPSKSVRTKYDNYDLEQFSKSKIEYTELDIPATRLNLTTECVFTVDCVNSIELQNAISFKRLKDGNFQVGLHIADVSHFVSPGSDLDKRARELLFSLVSHRSIYPMLPLPLSSDVGSLVPNRNRYAVSVLMTFDQNYNLINSWMGRTVIRSCAKLSIVLADKLIQYDGSISNSSITVYNGYSMSDLQRILRELSSILHELRDTELKNHELLLYKPLYFIFLKKSIYRIRGRDIEKQESHNILQQLMILINKIVGRIIVEKGFAGSIMTIQSIHKEQMLKVIDFLKGEGFNVDISSIVSLDLSLYNIMKKHGYFVALCIFYTIYENIQPIKYNILRRNEESKIFDRENYHHFYHNIHFFTNFTSPLKNYIDLFVHQTVLNGDRIDPTKKDSFESLQNIIDFINPTYDMNQNKTNHQAYLELWLWLKRNGPRRCKATFIPNLGFNDKDKYTKVMIHTENIVIPFDGDHFLVNMTGYFKTVNVEVIAKQTDDLFNDFELPFIINII